MTTKEAFLKLTEKRGWYKDLGVSEGAAWTMAKRVRDGEYVSLDKMEEILGKAGYVVVQEKLWATAEMAPHWKPEVESAIGGVKVFAETLKDLQENTGGLSTKTYDLTLEK